MRNAIYAELDRLRKLFKTSDPYELMDCLKLHLFVRGGLGKLKGFYCNVLNERYVVINDDLDEHDKLLVAAHELGHDRLHQKLAKASPMQDFMLYDMTSQAEYEANLFAAELLVSDESVIEALREDSDFFSLCHAVGQRPQLVTFKLYGMLQRGYPVKLPESPKSAFLAD